MIRHSLNRTNCLCHCATNVTVGKQRIILYARPMGRKKPSCICAKRALAPSRLGWMRKPMGSRIANSVEARPSAHFLVHQQLFTPAARAGQTMLGFSSTCARESDPNCSIGVKATSSRSKCALISNAKSGPINSVAKLPQISEGPSGQIGTDNFT